LNELFAQLRDSLAAHVPEVAAINAAYGPFRDGDVRHSQADIGKARRLLGFAPAHSLAEGLQAAMPWYVKHLRTPAGTSARAVAGR
jgi:UDP-N-acetylglucosamine 4-epimerase